MNIIIAKIGSLLVLTFSVTGMFRKELLIKVIYLDYEGLKIHD